MLRNKIKQYKWRITSAMSIVILAMIFVFAGCSSGSSAPENTNTESKSPAAANEDLVIPISEISETATYYPVKVDGVKLEVLAVKAKDGSIRTAFNTCQVCYGSGRGYYKQEGDVLVCQNCGNQFSTDDVEISRGGCNPVPIFPENKTIDDTSITISKEYLAQAKDIFANWKTSY